MKGRVLIVDDDDALRGALVDTLRDDGYEIEEARDGLEARERLESGVHVDAILLDVMMPRMNGIEFRQWQIDSAFAAIPVVVATAATKPPPELLEPPLRASTVLLKPFDLEVLLAELSRLCQG
jgi:chemosensory pili system protein ChpA (sensor histidine kinase/response regulator)